MDRGLLLDNLDQPANSSYRKLKAMGAAAVGTLWTGGTKHRRNVYEACEAMLRRPRYLIRVGGHRQTPAEWLQDARDALAEVPDYIYSEDRVLLVCGNEPDQEGYVGKPKDYIDLYRAVSAVDSVPIAAAAPSFGPAGGLAYFGAMCSEYGRPFPRLVANLYAHLVAELLPAVRRRCDKLYIGEVNTLDVPNRVPFLRGAFRSFEAAGVEAALIFIAGGASNGAWDETYILSEDEAAALGALPEGPTMDEATQAAMIEMEARQNALITKALIALREGRWTGADGVDGMIVALNGGRLPDNYKPVFPPKA